MSTPGGEVVHGKVFPGYCLRFSSGRWCNGSCSLKHDWKAFNAAKKEKKRLLKSENEAPSQQKSSNSNKTRKMSPTALQNKEGAESTGPSQSMPQRLQNKSNQPQVQEKMGKSWRGKRKERKGESEPQQATEDMKSNNSKRSQRWKKGKKSVEPSDNSLIVTQDLQQTTQALQHQNTSAEPHTAAPQTTPTTFRDLPAELRLKIWQWVIYHPTRFTIRLAKAKDKNGNQKGWRFRPRTAVPTVLHVCHESRQEALRYYRLSFGTTFNLPRVYFNYSRDHIYLNTRSYSELFLFIDIMDPHDVENVENVVIKVRDWTCNSIANFCERIWKLRSLKHLVLLISDRAEDEIYSQNPETATAVRAELKEFRKAHGFRGRYLPHVTIQVVPNFERHQDSDRSSH